MKNLLITLVIIGLSVFCSTTAKSQDFEPIYESSPSEAVIYNGNVGFIKDKVPVYSEKKLSLILPNSIILESLNLLDSNKEVNSLFFDKVTSSGGEKNRVTWQSSTPGKRNVELTYLINGIGWKPVYNMTIINDNQVEFSYNIVITNNAIDLENVAMKLVSGFIGGEQTGQVYNYNMNIAQSSIIDSSSSGTGKPERVNAYYTYDLGVQTVKRGGLTSINLLKKLLTCKKYIVWDTRLGQQVNVIYKVQNDSDKPFAEGLVRIYQKGLYMGSDIVEWTPPGSNGSITMGGLSDIRVKKTVSIEEAEDKDNYTKYHHKITLEINNFDKKDLPLKVIDTKYPDRREVKYEEKPSEEPGKTVIWEITVPSNGKKIINYEFTSGSIYTEPYSQY